MLDGCLIFAYWPITLFVKNELYQHIGRYAEYLVFRHADIILSGAKIANIRQAPIIGRTLQCLSDIVFGFHLLPPISFDRSGYVCGRHDLI